MIRVAAVGDVHYDHRSRPEFKLHFSLLREHADLLLLAGDLTQAGTIEEAKALSEDLAQSTVPVITVLGNHDHHSNKQNEICAVLKDHGVIILEGNSQILKVKDFRVGVVGIKGFGGGFMGACVAEFGEQETKSFARYSKSQAEILRSNLESVKDTDFRFALMHFSPIEGTLLGEKREIYPFLGSYLLGEALDQVGVHAAFHGHAHHGIEKGMTPAGIPVRNVALPVIRHIYHVYTFKQSEVTHI